MRIIDADALQATVIKILDNSIGGAYDGAYQCFVAINNAPTVEYSEQITIKCDAEEDKQKLLSALRNVKLKAIIEEERPQGKWIDTGNMEEYWAEEYQCSICGEKDHWHHYCPNCGTYMGESEDEDYEQ